MRNPTYEVRKLLAKESVTNDEKAKENPRWRTKSDTLIDLGINGAGVVGINCEQLNLVAQR